MATSGTKPGRLLKHHIPLRTDRWDVSEPGFTEIDLVSHSGDWAEGEFAHSLNVVDILSAWVDTRAVLGKSQVRVQEGLETIRQALPFALNGIDSDNGSEFINAHLERYCQLAPKKMPSPASEVGVGFASAVPPPAWSPTDDHLPDKEPPCQFNSFCSARSAFRSRSRSA